jgi:metallo-beta-lactamase class B
LAASAFSVLTLLLNTVPVSAQVNDDHGSWNEPVEPFLIMDNLYYVGASEITAYLFVTDQGHILLDGGFEETAPLIEASIEKLGFKLSDVKMLLNSHAHFDHCGGLAALKDVTGASLLVMQGDVEAVESGGASEGDPFPFPPVKVDGTLKNGANVKLGQTTLVAHRTPGHTRGCTTWSTQLRFGDSTYNVVFVGSPNILPEMTLLNNERYPDIVSDFRLGFERMAALPCDIMLGSHGSYFVLSKKIESLKESPETNPFIEPDRYAKFVEQKRLAFEERLASDLAAAQNEE